jgi:hypothetical protein
VDTLKARVPSVFNVGKMVRFLLLRVVMVLTFAANVSSAARAEDSAEYKQAIRLGSAEFEAGNYAEARSQFTRAHSASPNARTFRALGMVEFELKNYGESIEYLKGSLASQVRPLEPKQREEAELLLSRARGYVARLSVEIDPAVATVLLDGVPVKLDQGGTLVVKVGDHVLEFRAPGRLAEKRALKVSGGEERSLHVVLPVPEAPSRSDKGGNTAPQPTGTTRVEKKPLYKKPWLWVVLGVVVAGAAAGTAIALARNQDHGSAMTDGSNPPTLMPP